MNLSFRTGRSTAESPAPYKCMRGSPESTRENGHHAAVAEQPDSGVGELQGEEDYGDWSALRRCEATLGFTL